MKNVGVDCQFQADGRVTVQRIHLDNQWRTVEQGRQWVDHEGRHILVMLPGQPVQELVLGKEMMTWSLRPQGKKVYLA